MDLDFDLDEAEAMMVESDRERNGGGGGGGGGRDDRDVVAGAGAGAAVVVAPPPPLLLPPAAVNNETATYRDLEQLLPSQPFMFERTRIDYAMNVNQVPVWSPRDGQPELMNIIYALHHTGPPATRRAYGMQDILRQCLYGSIRIANVLRPRLVHDAADIPWESTDEVVAVKALSWPDIRARRNNDDPLTEVAALQFVMHHVAQQQQQQQQNNDKNNNNNITPVLDVLQDADFLYIIMPFYTHRSLADVLSHFQDRNHPEIRAIPEAFAKAFFLRILQSLAQLRQLGICHGDVSLENFVVGIDGKVAMIDFGSCLRVPYHDPITNTAMPAVVEDGNHHQHHIMLRRLIVSQGQRGRTSQYMAPEIYANRLPFDGYAIDLWGAAISLFVMLVGDFPWEMPLPGNIHYDFVTRDPLPPFIPAPVDQYALGHLALAMGCPPDQISPLVVDLLTRMLRHDPRERLTLAQVLGHPWIQGGPVAATQEQIQQELAPQDPWRA